MSTYICGRCRDGEHHRCSEPGVCQCTINPDTLEDESAGLRWQFGSVEPKTVFVIRDRDTGEEVARIPITGYEGIEIPAGTLKDGRTYVTCIEEPSSLRSDWSTPVTFQPGRP